MRRKVNATRMELMRVRKRLALAERGHKLLKDKLEGLIKELTERLQSLVEKHSHVARMEEVGRSSEGRELFLVSVGSGSEKILLWSQMHGDEPTATSSLLDIIDFIGKRSQEPWVSDVLEKYTLLMIPMLNPDGAERFQRRNAQDIDINRDARDLVTPEGQTLKAVRDRYEPFLGFNLHNQGTMTTVGDTGKVATIALLAVAMDVPGVTPKTTSMLRVITPSGTWQRTSLFPKRPGSA